MKIKKHGKNHCIKDVDSELFICKNCGCEFEAKPDEYYVDCNGANFTDGQITLTYTLSTTRKDYYVCSCPECSKIVKKIHESQNYWYINTSPTTTTSSITINGTSSSASVLD